jgi:hypothetical protein
MIPMRHDALTGVLGGVVVSDGAAGRGAQEGVMMGEMARDSADHGALDAAFGGRLAPRERQGQSDCN